MSRWETHIAPYLPEIEKWARKGNTDSQIAGMLSIGYSTFRRCKKEHPELKKILARGRNDKERIVKKALAENIPSSQNTPRGSVRSGALAIAPGPHARPDQQGTHRIAFERNKKRIYATQDVCGICGRPVDKKLKYPHPMSACIDHIIPVAKGGHPSAIENLQLAHWACNRQKSDKLINEDSKLINGEIISNRILPLSIDWANYRANE